MGKSGQNINVLIVKQPLMLHQRGDVSLEGRTLLEVLKSPFPSCAVISTPDTSRPGELRGAGGVHCLGLWEARRRSSSDSKAMVQLLLRALEHSSPPLGASLIQALAAYQPGDLSPLRLRARVLQEGRDMGTYVYV